MQGSRLRRPSPATVIAAIALFVALGSGAYAATHLPRNSVGSKTIKNGAVKSPDIHNGAVKGHDIGEGQVKAGKLKLTHTSVVGSSSATTSNAPVDLGGPTVTVDVPRGGVVEIFAEAQIAETGGGQNAEGTVYLTEPHLLPTPSQILASGAPNLQTRFTSPGTNDADGVINPARASWITIVPPGPGTYTFSLRYAAPGGGTATFQNRGLLVRVTR